MFDDEMLAGLRNNCAILIEAHNEAHPERQLPVLQDFMQEDMDYVVARGQIHIAQAAKSYNANLVIQERDAAKTSFDRTRDTAKYRTELRLTDDLVAMYPHRSEDQIRHYARLLKLTTDQVVEAYELWLTGTSNRSLALRYNTTPGTVARLMARMLKIRPPKQAEPSPKPAWLPPTKPYVPQPATGDVLARLEEFVSKAGAYKIEQTKRDAEPLESVSRMDEEMMQQLYSNCIIMLKAYNQTHERKLPSLDQFTRDDVDYCMATHHGHFARAALWLNPNLIQESNQP